MEASPPSRQATLLAACLEGLDRSGTTSEVVDVQRAAASSLMQRAYNGIELAQKAHARAANLARKGSDTNGASSPTSKTPDGLPRRLPNRSRRLQDRAAHAAERASYFRDLGRTALAEAQISRCRKHAEDAVSLDDENVGARFLLVGCLMYQGEFTEAKNEALVVLSSLCEEHKQFMDDPVVHLVLAHLSRRLGDPEGAASHLKQAANDYPLHPRPCLVLADLLCNRGKRGASMVMAKEALDRDADRRCPDKLNVSEKDAALSFVHQLNDDSEDDDLLAEVGADEEACGVQHRPSQNAAPGGMLSTVGPAIAFPTPAQSEAADSWTLDRKGTGLVLPVWSPRRDGSPAKLRSKRFAAPTSPRSAGRLRQSAYPGAPRDILNPGRMEFSKLIGDSDEQPAGTDQGLIIHEHVPKEPTSSRWGCAGVGTC